MKKQKFITVKVTKITLAKDGCIYMTVHHPLAKNYPSFVFQADKFTEIKNELKERYL